MTTKLEPTPNGAIATDLVEYLVLLVPGVEALATVGPELARTVQSAAIRILDLVVVRVDEDGAAVLVDTESMEGLDAVREVADDHGIVLSQHDIELVTLALSPGACAVVLVAEDRWAEPLARAARAAGGELYAGERIARDRVEAALARVTRPAKGDDLWTP